MQMNAERSSHTAATASNAAPCRCRVLVKYSTSALVPPSSRIEACQNVLVKRSIQSNSIYCDFPRNVRAAKTGSWLNLINYLRMLYKCLSKTDNLSNHAMFSTLLAKAERQRLPSKRTHRQRLPTVARAREQMHDVWCSRRLLSKWLFVAAEADYKNVPGVTAAVSVPLGNIGRRINTEAIRSTAKALCLPLDAGVILSCTETAVIELGHLQKALFMTQQTSRDSSVSLIKAGNAQQTRPACQQCTIMQLTVCIIRKPTSLTTTSGIQP